MSDIVERICRAWVEDGLADECFWEMWSECPTPEDTLTPAMVLTEIERLRARVAELETSLQRTCQREAEGIARADANLEAAEAIIDKENTQ